MCHPRTPSSTVETIEAVVKRACDGRWRVSYAIRGDIARLRIPEPREARFADELWRRTCVELFARARQDDGPYFELNFSPSGEWAVYAFERYREGMSPCQSAGVPRIELRRDERTLHVDTIFEAKALPAPAVIALAAVIEEQDNTVSYWALAHAGEKPDFHDPRTFLLELE